jgi:hypothetical protein
MNKALTLNLSTCNVVTNRLWTPAINLTSRTVRCAQDLFHGALQILGQTLVPHRPGNVDDLIKRDRLGVLDVLFFLTVAGWLLQRLDHERRGRGDDRDGGLTVLDREAHGHAQPFPVSCGLGDVFSDLFGGETERTDLGGERR